MINKNVEDICVRKFVQNSLLVNIALHSVPQSLGGDESLVNFYQEMFKSSKVRCFKCDGNKEGCKNLGYQSLKDFYRSAQR